MKKNILYFLLFIFFIFLIGCASKTTPIFVTIKSPKIRISDEGFLEEGTGYKKLVIYKLGSTPITIILKNNLACINNKCINKYIFVKKYFNIDDKNIFDIILNKKPFDNVKIIKIKDGFIQKKGFFYKVTNNIVLFKRKNLIIYIKFLDIKRNKK